METLSLPNITLQGFAQGGWQTSISVPEVGAIFDVGTLLPVRADHYFITHGHPDHMGALPHLIARRTIEAPRKPPFHLYYPAALDVDLRAGLTALARTQGDRGDLPVVFHPVEKGDSFPLPSGFTVRALRTYHRIPSCGWAVEQQVKKLRPEFVGLPGPEIARLRKSGVDVLYESTNTVLVIPGDTTIDFLRNEPQAQDARILTHEVTSWGHYNRGSCVDYGHTHVDDMLEHAHLFRGEYLILVHRSMKHTRAEIEEIVQTRFPSALREKVKLFDGGDNQVRRS